MRGRRPKPSQVKRTTGNPGKRPLNENEPQPEPGIPDPPEELTPDAREEWDRLAQQLDDLGLLTQIDRAALVLYCQSYGDWLEARRQIAATGKVVRAPSGYPVLNPFVTIANKAADQMRAILTEFGMTPASRSRISVPTRRKKENPFAAIGGHRGSGSLGAEKYFS